ncbi:relaxase/mobilization nuclease domain-containing protein [Mucilaginibacter paludis]|uniref:Relaxase/mobilization nuclease family protein n=1 Tax=Mucilaginibacter paludis DSM 18603 TaxID=714943 RepID=H1YHU2_9SPHI|nr:relaxase/mobilization nuclease domain-containing protein [Mucilaginibacter paludis]EHQ27492.1 Relaxase/mobilization nuclease family protein [Mucilaginibacter paludis DSM 18603]
MVAKIVSGKYIRGILHYNENKVTAGQAQLIMASGFAGEIDRMSFDNKLKRFENLIMTNSKVVTNALHISLNFDASEKLDNARLQAIAKTYMDKIGFGDQPFLVYRHTDAGHSHVHIVTTNIQPDGKRIPLHNIGLLKSEPARKQIEQEFNLVRAESKTFKQHAAVKPADIEKAVYGHLPTKRAISNVVGAVMNQYSFTSLAEFNAALRQFNVQADRGKEDTMMFQKKGLIYSLLDKNGQPIGIPIKASAFYSKPTLANLEKKFVKNAENRKEYRDDLKAEIENVFKNYRQITKATFIKELQSQNIQAIFRQNDQGLTYGVTFVDNTNMAVFKGSDLGKAYGAKALTERFGQADQPLKPATHFKTAAPKQTYLKTAPATDYLKTGALDKTLQALMGKNQGDGTPLTPRRKKRKKQEQGMQL